LFPSCLEVPGRNSIADNAPRKGIHKARKYTQLSYARNLRVTQMHATACKCMHVHACARNARNLPRKFSCARDNRVWLCIGEVNGMKVDGKPVDRIDCDLLMESTVLISYQILGLRSSHSEDDPTLKFDWRTYPMKEHTFTAPGRLIQPIDPEMSTSKSIKDPIFYLLESRFLVALAASLFEGLIVSDIKSIPKIGLGTEYPYRERLGTSVNLLKFENRCSLGCNLSFFVREGMLPLREGGTHWTSQRHQPRQQRFR